jgi:membrane-associated phospholipid phosphatase
MPFLGVYTYFILRPSQINTTAKDSVLIIVFLLTIIFPILLFITLKKTKIIGSIHLKTTRERIIPLILNAIIIILITQFITPVENFIELYYFFTGILLSTLACLFLAILKFKASIHMIAVSGILMYFIAIGVHFYININLLVALLFIINGAVATSRLYMNAHTPSELIIGFFIGLVPQLILVNYWL